MNKHFTPSFRHFHNDVERYLKKCEGERTWPGGLSRLSNGGSRDVSQKSFPEKIPEELVTKTRDLLLESLHRLQQYASELGHESDVKEYLAMTGRVEKRMKA